MFPTQGFHLRVCVCKKIAMLSVFFFVSFYRLCWCAGTSLFRSWPPVIWKEGFLCGSSMKADGLWSWWTIEELRWELIPVGIQSSCEAFNWKLFVVLCWCKDTKKQQFPTSFSGTFVYLWLNPFFSRYYSIWCKNVILSFPSGEWLHVVTWWYSSSHRVQGRFCVGRLSQRTETLVLGD